MRINGDLICFEGSTYWSVEEMQQNGGMVATWWNSIHAFLQMEFLRTSDGEFRILSELQKTADKDDAEIRGSETSVFISE